MTPHSIRSIFVALVVLIGPAAVHAQLPPPTDDAADAFRAQKHYSPYAGRNFPTRVFWGDTHLHTGMSMDAGAFGARLDPYDAYRFAAASRSRPRRACR